MLPSGPDRRPQDMNDSGLSDRSIFSAAVSVRARGGRPWADPRTCVPGPEVLHSDCVLGTELAAAFCRSPPGLLCDAQIRGGPTSPRVEAVAARSAARAFQKGRFRFMWKLLFFFELFIPCSLGFALLL